MSGQLSGLWIPLAFTTFAAFIAFSLRRKGRKQGLGWRADVASILLFVGSAAFASAHAVSYFFGEKLNYVELPNGFVGITEVHTGKKSAFVISGPLRRVQRYDVAGRFTNGWFVDSGGGRIEVTGINTNEIELCAFRRKRSLTYSFDGSLIRQSEGCKPEIKFGDLGERDTATIKSSWLSWAFMPLVDPILSWLIGVSGLAYSLIKLERPQDPLMHTWPPQR